MKDLKSILKKGLEEAEKLGEYATREEKLKVICDTVLDQLEIKKTPPPTKYRTRKYQESQEQQKVKIAVKGTFNKKEKGFIGKSILANELKRREKEEQKNKT